MKDAKYFCRIMSAWGKMALDEMTEMDRDVQGLKSYNMQSLEEKPQFWGAVRSHGEILSK